MGGGMADRRVIVDRSPTVFGVGAVHGRGVVQWPLRPAWTRRARAPTSADGPDGTRPDVQSGPIARAGRRAASTAPTATSGGLCDDRRGEPDRRRHAAARRRRRHPRLALRRDPAAHSASSARSPAARWPSWRCRPAGRRPGRARPRPPAVRRARRPDRRGRPRRIARRGDRARACATRLGNGAARAADRTAGAGLGVVQALLIVWLAGSLLAEGPVPRLAETAGSSTAVRTIDRAPAAADRDRRRARRLARRRPACRTSSSASSRCRRRRSTARPTRRPRAIAAAAEASTLKVSAATCGLSSVGTGFVVAYGYVVTNAHVVAGADSRRRPGHHAPGGRVLDAVPVLFDPGPRRRASSTSTGLAVPPLAFARTDPGRGAIGATLGYPGGGALKILPAAVSAAIPATGRDIYGVTTVRREVLELRAADRPRRQRRSARPDRWHGRWRRLRRGARPTRTSATRCRRGKSRRASRPAIGRTAAVDTGDCVADLAPTHGPPSSAARYA